ncbi:hypothetical protein GOBAR_DD23850 [Gossypium barbadense]|nr:hypothetical protein GOBAR_DD23850 [Gossypium barbadense]
MGVAATSVDSPYLIHLCYKPPSGPIKAKLALVGKGSTLDSGGQNIKTGLGCSTETMKTDTGGSAALLGTAKRTRCGGRYEANYHHSSYATVYAYRKNSYVIDL